MSRAKSKANNNAVYVYGARVRDEESRKRIDQQLWLAQNYYNYLCAAEIERRNTFREIRCELGGQSYIDLLEEQQLISDIIKNIKQVKLGKYNCPETRKKFIPRIKNLQDNPAYIELDDLKKRAKALRELEAKENARIYKDHFKKWYEKVDLLGRIEKECLKEIKTGNAKKKEGKEGRVSVTSNQLLGEINRRVQNAVLELSSVPDYWKNNLRAEMECLQKDFLWREMNTNCKTPVSRTNDDGKRETVWIDTVCSLGTDSYDEIRTKAIPQAKENAVFNPNFRKPGSTRVLAAKPDKKKGNELSSLLDGAQSKIKMVLSEPVSGKKQGKHSIYNIDLKLGDSAGFVHLSFKMHRPIPEDARINNIYIVKSRIGKRNHYEVQFLLQSDMPLIQQAPTGEKTVGVRFGWHKEDNNDLLFATAFDGNDIHEYFLPFDVWQQEEYIRSLQEAADNYFNDVSDVIKTWNSRNKGACDKAYKNGCKLRNRKPKSFKQAYENWNKYSQGWELMTFGMLSTFCNNNEHKEAWKLWKKNRLNRKTMDLFCQGDENHFEVICNFLKSVGYTQEEQIVSIYLYFYQLKNNHLLQMVRDLQNKLTNYKLDYYRKWAVELAREYGYVKYEEYDLREVARKKSPEKDISSIPKINGQANPNTVRQVVGIYRAKEAIKAVFRDRCMDINPSVIDKTHIDCGGNLPEDYKSENGSDKTKCPKCGKDWHIRENRAMQIYNAPWVAKEKKGKKSKKDS